MVVTLRGPISPLEEKERLGACQELKEFSATLLGIVGKPIF